MPQVRHLEFQGMETKHAIITERCMSCKYCLPLESNGVKGVDSMYCAYYVLTQKRRGCEAGDNCDKFEKKTRGRRSRDEYKITFGSGC